MLVPRRAGVKQDRSDGFEPSRKACLALIVCALPCGVTCCQAETEMRTWTVQIALARTTDAV